MQFLFLAGLLGIGLPVAVLMGAAAGTRTAAAVYADPVSGGMPAAAR
jgi:hypothetical protein